MNELDVIVTNFEPCTIDWNFEELKHALKTELEIYEQNEYTDVMIPNAKQDLASLRKLKKAINDKRIEIKNKCLEPYEVLEKQAKELTELIDKPINMIDYKVKDYEDRQKLERNKAIANYFDEMSEGIPKDLKEIIWSKKKNPKWLNATTPVKTWQSEINNIISEVQKDVEILKNFDDYCMAAAYKAYKQTLDIRAAFDKKKEIDETRQVLIEIAEKKQQEKEERERQKREAQEKKAQEAQKAEHKTTESAQTEQETNNTISQQNETNNQPRTDVKHDDNNTGDISQGREIESGKITKIIRFTGTPEQFNKVLAYMRFIGAEYEADNKVFRGEE